VLRVAAPLRIATRVEDGAEILVDAQLLDHYLRTADRREGEPLLAAEARRIREAMQVARREGTARAILGAPKDAVDLGREVWSTLREGDDRSPVERLVDTLLDGLSDAPEGALGEVIARFDAHLENA